MDLAKLTRLNRIFSNPSGKLCSVAVDHFMGYQKGLPEGLVNVPKAIAEVMKAKPDAMTMLKGMAKGVWSQYAGSVPLIIQSVYFTLDDATIQSCATPSEALRMGADAFAVAIGVRGPGEGAFLKILTDAVAEADSIGLPVVAHIYPRDYSGGVRIVHDHENIMWAVRAGIECGADIIKVPYTGNVESYSEIVATCPVPLVAAGGPKCDTLRESLDMMRDVIASGARGATIGRNIWGHPQPEKAAKAFMTVIHDNVSAEEALTSAGLK